MSQTLHTDDGHDPATQSRRVFIATPCYERPSGIYETSMLRTLTKLERLGIGWEHDILLHNCHVDDARNTLVRNFRGSKCTDLFFVDADNGWSSDDFVRMLNIDEEFVCGIYPLKSMDQSEWPVAIKGGEIRGKPDPWSYEGIVEILRGPTGMMRLRRSVIDKMVERWGDRKYRGGDQRDDLPLSVILFERTFGTDPGAPDDPETRRWGGDWAFCNKWRGMGGTIWCDPQMRFQHYGPWTFDGSIGEHWRQIHGVTAEQRKLKLNELMNVVVADPVKASTDVKLILDIMETWNNPWALPPDQLSVLMTLALQAEGPTLECGSGVSTLLLGAIAKYKGSKHFAIEHNRWHAATNFVHLRRYGLARSVEIVPAELTVQNGSEWYDIAGEMPKDFGLLLVDGPPQERDVAIRWQALERLLPFLAPGAYILADDVDQKGLSQHLAEWERLVGAPFHVMKGNPRHFAVGRIPQAALSVAS